MSYQNEPQQPAQHQNQQQTQHMPIYRTEVYTFPGYGESVICTFAGRDPDPQVKRPREAERRRQE